MQSYGKSNRRKLPEQVTTDLDLEERLSVCIQAEVRLDASLDNNFIYNACKNRESLFDVQMVELHDTKTGCD